MLACACCCVVLIVSSSLLGVSFDTLEPTQVGIIYDHNIEHLEIDKLWTHGRYLVGLGKSFIGWANNWMTMNYGSGFYEYAFGPSILVRSYDGLRVYLDVSFTYSLSLKVQDLSRLYQDFELDHQGQYGRVLKQVVADVASDYYAMDFFGRREDIQNDMFLQLNTSLNAIYATVQHFELVNINFHDSSYDDSITATQVALQDVLQAYAEQAVYQVQADAAVQVAQQTAVTLLQTANQTALSYIAAVEADADVLLYRIGQQAEALYELRQSLSLNTSQQLLAYNYYTALLENTVLDVLYATNYPKQLQATMDQLGVTIPS